MPVVSKPWHLGGLAETNCPEVPATDTDEKPARVLLGNSFHNNGSGAMGSGPEN